MARDRFDVDCVRHHPCQTQPKRSRERPDRSLTQARYAQIPCFWTGSGLRRLLWRAGIHRYDGFSNFLCIGGSHEGAARFPQRFP